MKKRIIDNNLLEYKCECCGLEPFWNGKPLLMVLDHINGKNNDNRLENLRFVCSNCDSQLDTYKKRVWKSGGAADHVCLENEKT